MDNSKKIGKVSEISTAYQLKKLTPKTIPQISDSSETNNKPAQPVRVNNRQQPTKVILNSIKPPNTVNQISQLSYLKQAANHQPVKGPSVIDLFYQFIAKQPLSESTKKNYITWTLRFVRFCQEQGYKTQGHIQVSAFLTYLAKPLNFEPQVQQSALNALTFLFTRFLGHSLDNVHYYKNKQRVGYQNKFRANHCLGVINNLQGTHLLVAKLIVKANLKIREAINIRLGDINLKTNQIIIRHFNGSEKFSFNIPVALIMDIRIQLMKVRSLVQREKELNQAQGDIELDMLSQCLEPDWQYLFPYQHKNSDGKVLSYLNRLPLNVFKCDIKLAIEQYLRFLPDSAQKKM
ncbi:phage integrase N-terminal SAM-like domain-containing protein [Aliikangiella maris]|uniref:Phage integrase N-terminal SAM-like domain-containing protein n=2 Tax=Aliikangiella maris TaxID=3162458 RepID=A0ABV2BXA7_9GAMM